MFTFRRFAVWFTVPALVMVGLFALLPVVQSAILSFFHIDLKLNIFEPNGIGNFIRILKDERARNAFLQTIYFTAATVPLELAFGLILALILHERFRGRGVVRALSLVPWAMPSVVAALLWRWIFNDRFGLLNGILFGSGLTDSPLAFLTTAWGARVAVITAEVWKTTPFMSLLLLAGLQLIPEELYESAMVDGATGFQRFAFITLPLLVPAMLVALLFRTMDALRIFDTVFVLTGGGPGDSTETLSLYAYKTMFSFLDFGVGSALAVTVFGVVALVSLVYFLVLRKVTRE